MDRAGRSALDSGMDRDRSRSGAGRRLLGSGAARAMKHTGTTKKHAGSAKHTHHGHPKHNPQHVPQHHKDASHTPAHHHSPVHHAHKAAKSPKKSTTRGLALGCAVDFFG